MATPTTYHEAQEGLQGDLPCGGICLHYDSHLSFRPDWLHGLLQGCEPKRQGATAYLESRRRGEVMPILQQGDSPSELRATNIRSQVPRLGERMGGTIVELCELLKQLSSLQA
jgi:hypothetical protein